MDNSQRMFRIHLPHRIYEHHIGYWDAREDLSSGKGRMYCDLTDSIHMNVKYKNQIPLWCITYLICGSNKALAALKDVYLAYGFSEM